MDSAAGKGVSADQKSPDAVCHQRPNLGLFHQAPRMALVLAAVALSCLVLYHSSHPFQLPERYNPFTSNRSGSLGTGAVKLEDVLRNAAMENKTVLITTLNEAWAEPNSMFDLLLESFKIGNGTRRLLSHLVVVALDMTAYERCSRLHPHCFALSTKGIDFSGEANFMAPDYLKMMWRRIDFLGAVLELGYGFVFTDADIMWFRDPFLHFYQDADFQIACDFFNGDPRDLLNRPNGGFMYVKSNEKTVRFYKLWYKSRKKYPRLHDQDVLNKIKLSQPVSDIGLQIRFLDTAYFGGFCQPSKDLSKVCTMHANCCVGLDNKVHDLRIMLDDWRNYTAAQRNATTASRATSWTVPQLCGPRSFGARRPKKNKGKGSKS